MRMRLVILQSRFLCWANDRNGCRTLYTIPRDTMRRRYDRWQLCSLSWHHILMWININRWFILELCKECFDVQLDLFKVLYKAYLISKLEEDIDNIIDYPVISFEKFVNMLQKEKKCDIIKKNKWWRIYHAFR